jgi:hypothetical protein
MAVQTGTKIHRLIPAVVLERVTEWQAIRDARLMLRQIEEEYAPRLSAARGAKTPDGIAEIRQEYRDVRDHFEDVILERQTERLRRKAKRWLVPLPARPDQHEENQSWREGPSGGLIIKADAEIEARRAIRAERRQTFSLVVSVVFGFLGLLIGLVSVSRKP